MTSKKAQAFQADLEELVKKHDVFLNGTFQMKGEDEDDIAVVSIGQASIGDVKSSMHHLLEQSYSIIAEILIENITSGGDASATTH
jgi:prephenate dehydratase